MAKANAQANTSASPRRTSSRCSDSSASPTAATQAPVTGHRPGAWRSSRAPSRGVSTTDSPVMKPALDAVVYWSPTVWNPYPANSASPITAPAASAPDGPRSPPGWPAPHSPPRASRGRMAASSRAAARNR